MECQILFSGKSKKNITILSSAELAHRVFKVKEVDTEISSMLIVVTINR